MNKNIGLIFISLLIFIITSSCSMPTAKVPESEILIKISGTTVNPVNIGWQIHESSGSTSEIISSEISYSKIVPYNNFGAVYASVSNTGNIVKAYSSNTTDVSQNGYIKTITLDAPVTEVTANGSIETKDILVDTGASPALYFTITDVDYNSNAPDILIKIYDENDDFTDGAATGSGSWTVYKHNDADLTISIYRDGKILGNCPVTFSTIFEDIDLPCGSKYW